MIVKSKLSCLTIMALVLMSVALADAAANEIQFVVTDASFAPGSGYGIDANERARNATLLDVRFDTSGFVTQNFMLNSIGDSKTFNFGKIELREFNGHGGILPEETDLLGVQAYLTFLDPLGLTEGIGARATAVSRSLSDSHLDYSLIWDPIVVDLGLGGSFVISFPNVNFYHKKVSQMQTATITLQSLPEDIPLLSAGVPVHAPEPASLLLLGTGLGALGLAANRRRKK